MTPEQKTAIGMCIARGCHFNAAPGIKRCRKCADESNAYFRDRRLANKTGSFNLTLIRRSKRRQAKRLSKEPAFTWIA